jgi:hypothetical protein
MFPFRPVLKSSDFLRRRIPAQFQPLGFEFVCDGRFERESGLSGRLRVKGCSLTGYRNF